MRFIMCGAGAIGGVLGGQLAKAGFDVVLLDPRSAHVQAINQQGLQLHGVHGNHTVCVPAVQQARAVAFRPDDVIFMAVKSFHCVAAVTALRQATPWQLPVFCAQNGMSNEATVARYFSQVHGVMVLIAATHLQPGVVVHTGNGPVGLGTYPSGLNQTAQEVATALEATDLPVYTTTQIVPHKWNKMLLNLNNATLGLIGLSSQEAQADAAARLWIADVWEEGVRVLDAAGIAYEGPPGMGSIVERIREWRDSAGVPTEPAEVAWPSRSSLWQDLYLRRGQVEADEFNGVIVRLGRQYSVPTPYNRLLWQLSTALAAARQRPGTYTIQQLREHVRAPVVRGLWTS